MSKRSSNLREEILADALYGRITPEQAEARASEADLPPFERQPEFDAFDPMKKSRWSIVMAIAWVAWRDPQLVMEQGAEFRSQSTIWRFREWNEPVEGGQDFAQRAGWFLETWHEATAMRIAVVDARMRHLGQLPPTVEFTPTQAEEELWRALSDDRLKGEGFDRNGTLVEIPAREWEHLKLFEDGKRDVLRYDALNREEPFKDVRFRRIDLVRLWPASSPKANSEIQCRYWLASLMRESPERPKPKKEFQTEALKKFNPMSARQFVRAWDAAMEETKAFGWKKVGRPRAISNHRTN